jgi:hypothetical protein
VDSQRDHVFDEGDSFIVGNAENNERVLNQLMPLRINKHGQILEGRDLLQIMHL